MNKIFITFYLSLISMSFAASESHAGEHSGGWLEKWLTVDVGLLYWTILTFLVLLLLLRWKAWGPLMDTLDKREHDIKNAIFSAEKAKKQAQQASNDYDELVQKANSEAQQIISEGKVAGERIKSDLETSAKQNAEQMIEKAKSQIDAEKQKAIQEIKSQVIELSIEAASKIIEKNLDTDDNKNFVNSTLDNIGRI